MRPPLLLCLPSNRRSASDTGSDDRSRRHYHYYYYYHHYDDDDVYYFTVRSSTTSRAASRGGCRVFSTRRGARAAFLYYVSRVSEASLRSKSLRLLLTVCIRKIRWDWRRRTIGFHSSTFSGPPKGPRQLIFGAFEAQRGIFLKLFEAQTANFQYFEALKANL